MYVSNMLQREVAEVRLVEKAHRLQQAQMGQGMGLLLRLFGLIRSSRLLGLLSLRLLRFPFGNLDSSWAL